MGPVLCNPQCRFYHISGPNHQHGRQKRRCLLFTQNVVNIMVQATPGFACNMTSSRRDSHDGACVFRRGVHSDPTSPSVQLGGRAPPLTADKIKQMEGQLYAMQAERAQLYSEVLALRRTNLMQSFELAEHEFQGEDVNAVRKRCDVVPCLEYALACLADAASGHSASAQNC
jgi:hypothetical protein